MISIEQLVAGDTFRMNGNNQEFRVIVNSIDYVLIENTSTLEYESLYHDIPHLVIPISCAYLNNLAVEYHAL